MEGMNSRLQRPMKVSSKWTGWSMFWCFKLGTIRWATDENYYEVLFLSNYECYSFFETFQRILTSDSKKLSLRIAFGISTV